MNTQQLQNDAREGKKYNIKYPKIDADTIQMKETTEQANSGFYFRNYL